MAKKKATPKEAVPKEEYDLELPKQDPPQEEPAPAAPQHIVDKTYSYMVADAKGVLRRHSFKESQATEDDIMHFVRTLGEVYDKAPYLAKINFMSYAFPVMRTFLREHEPEILAVIMHEPEEKPN